MNNKLTKDKEIDQGLIPEGWEATELGDVCELKYGKGLPAREREVGAVDVYGSNGIIGKHDRYLSKGPGIIIGRKGSAGEVFISKHSYWPIDTTYYIQDNDKYCIEFLYYKLLTLGLKKYKGGCAVPGLNRDELYSITLAIPKKISEQRKIAEVLGVLDEKIEVLRKMNKILESIGHTIFKQFFTHNEERLGWQERKLGEFVELVNGASYKSSELSNSDTALITLGNFVRGGGFKRSGFKEYTGKLKTNQIIHDGDVLVAHTDVTQKAEIAGVPALATGITKYKTVGISMDVVKVNSLDDNISSGLLYFLLMSPEFQGYKYGYVSGTTVLHLNKRCIPNFPIKMPTETKELLKISNFFQPVIEKMAQNEDEIEILSQIRDSLLPRLMSGKLRMR